MAKIFHSISSKNWEESRDREELSWPELKQKLIQICTFSKHVMASIYDIKRNEFLSCSNSMQQVLGYDPCDIVNKGWRFWYNLIDPREAKIVRKRVTKFINIGKHTNDGTIFLKYHLKSANGSWRFIKHRLELHCYKNEYVVINYLYDISEQETIDKYLTPADGYIYQIKKSDVDISVRECEVLKLIANGFSSKQIADKLYISDHTVITHRKHLIEKFQVRNTAHLIKKASEIILL